MEVKNDLPAFFTDIKNQFVTLKPPLARQFPSNSDEMSNQRLIRFRNVRDCLDVFFWNNENVNRRSGIDIIESNNTIVFKFNGGGRFSVCNVTKNTGQI